MPLRGSGFDNVRVPELGSSKTAAPPQLYFVVSAVFHYLGPAFAVLLFARVEPLGAHGGSGVPSTAAHGGSSPRGRRCWR